MESTILIIEDESKLLGLLARIIEGEGYQVLKAPSAKAGLKLLNNDEIRVVITDVKLPDANGVELVKLIKDIRPYIEVINLTAFGSIKDGVRAIKNGAFDYIIKGDDNDRIIPLVSSAMDKASLQFQIHQINKRVSQNNKFGEILGKSPAIIEAIDLAKRVANTKTTVLLLGETGTGKEVFASAIHEESDRRNKPFVAVNCSSFSDELLKSELFGHVAGAFTGAIKDKKGLFEEAEGGTLFLDEIGEMNLELQSKVLRVLENGTYNKVGESRTSQANVRIIAATNKDLKHEAEHNRFRPDLFYRLAVFTIYLPPLRERNGDIEMLAKYFLKEFAYKLNRNVKHMDEAFLKVLKVYPWKGNIRELRNVMERVVILANSDTLTCELLPFEFFKEDYMDENTLDLANIEHQFIRKALLQSKGNKTEAAKLLGIGLSTLYRKIEEYKL
ncbi:sigma-54 dependent transcriptional regulator [uncultured Mucilaginibacter sp.]|uniref:sigma-54-dependent transcriptional regulator n=1 Tax=uncultured Mucilaginibacter sp. TaxID=797541 RepID=UPI0025E35429|nr:sigma-54 dependent transcriptional regulator [uncultured Mucilaginibacter sp.]